MHFLNIWFYKYSLTGSHINVRCHGRSFTHVSLQTCDTSVLRRPRSSAARLFVKNTQKTNDVAMVFTSCRRHVASMLVWGSTYTRYGQLKWHNKASGPTHVLIYTFALHAHSRWGFLLWKPNKNKNISIDYYLVSQLSILIDKIFLEDHSQSWTRMIVISINWSRMRSV